MGSWNFALAATYAFLWCDVDSSHGGPVLKGPVPLDAVLDPQVVAPIPATFVGEVRSSFHTEFMIDVPF